LRHQKAVVAQEEKKEEEKQVKSSKIKHRTSTMNNPFGNND
jgi:hypothetical protein